MKRHLNPSHTHEVREQPKRKPAEVKTSYPEYWRERDRLIYKTADTETRAAILERYGIR